MKLLVTPIKFTEVCSLGWKGVKSIAADYIRYMSSETIMVETKSGIVKGFKIPSNFGYQYINFIGIPYAKSPIGELRFKDPEPFEPSTEIINKEHGLRGSMACQQDFITNTMLGNENCLHLSVFTHDVKPEILKPVMIWIHGGGFLFGSNSKDLYNPEYLLCNDIVLVSINYRLGIAGFASFQDPELGIPGNAGLKDQAMAMKWVKEHCIHFGGDPDNITLIGESAGGTSVALHLISDFSKDLFHKAIIMSGAAYAPWAVYDSDKTQRLAKLLGWNGEGGEAACLKVLQQATPNAIVKVQEDILTREDRERLNFIPMGPVIEPYESTQCFLSKDPKELTKTAWSKNVPLIIGSCSSEGLLFYKMINKEPDLMNSENLKYILPFKELEMDVESQKCNEISKKLKQLYFGQSTPCLNTLSTYLMLLNDKAFAHPLHRTILSRAKYQLAPTYLLRFDFDTFNSLMKQLCVGRSEIQGVCHAEDCQYYFRTTLAGPVPSPDTDEWKTIDRMCKIFTTFAATGDPNNESIAPVKWTPVTIETNEKSEWKYKCLNIAKDVSHIDWPELERMQFWDNIYKQCNHDIV